MDEEVLQRKAKDGEQAAIDTIRRQTLEGLRTPEGRLKPEGS
jgi:hypothetical protein